MEVTDNFGSNGVLPCGAYGPRAAKAAVQEQYSEVHTEVKRCVRVDKRGHIDNMLRQTEEVAAQRNVKDIHYITRKLAGRYQQTDKPSYKHNSTYHNH